MPHRIYIGKKRSLAPEHCRLIKKIPGTKWDGWQYDVPAVPGFYYSSHILPGPFIDY